MKKKIMSIFGTRPEAIKMAPLVKQIEMVDSFQSLVCVTAQHREMLDQILDRFQINPDYDLDIMTQRQTIASITSKALAGIDKILEKENPDIVLVHGDTTTTLCAAMSAFYRQIKIGHVEAGLRTNDVFSPFPEEFNRETVSLIADFNFAPTEKAKNNLLKEGRTNIFVTGNTAIDAVKMNVDKNFKHELLDWVDGKKLILLTAHRRENLGKPMENMFKAIYEIALERDDIKVVYPIHKNPVVRETANKIFKDKDIIKLVEPLDVYDFQNIMARAHIVLTDSGGIQEEAPSLGIPVLVMRNVTERPEGVEAGTLKLVGTNKEKIYNSIKQLLDSEKEYNAMAKASNPYGDGHASEKIVEILKNML